MWKTPKTAAGTIFKLVVIHGGSFQNSWADFLLVWMDILATYIRYAGFMPIEHFKRSHLASVKYGFDDRTYNIPAAARWTGPDGIMYKELAKIIGIRAETILFRISTIANYDLVRTIKNLSYANRVIVSWDELYIVDATQHMQKDFEKRILVAGLIDAISLIQKNSIDTANNLDSDLNPQEFYCTVLIDRLPFDLQFR